MDNLPWLMPLLVTVMLGAIGWLVKIAIDYTGVKKDLESAIKDVARLQEGFDENKKWNRDEHEKLFNSRNDIEKVIIQLQTTLHGMDEKLQEILERERARNGSH